MIKQGDDPLIQPLSEGDRAFVGYLLPVLFASLLAYLGWSAGTGQRLRDLDTTDVSIAEFKIDINQATWPELALLPGIGEMIGKRIVAYRESHGDFRRLDELRAVHGIGEKSLERIRPYVLSIVDRCASDLDALVVNCDESAERKD